MCTYVLIPILIVYILLYSKTELTKSGLCVNESKLLGDQVVDVNRSSTSAARASSEADPSSTTKVSTLRHGLQHAQTEQSDEYLTEVTNLGDLSSTGTVP